MFRPGRQASPCTCRSARRCRRAPAGRSGPSWPARRRRTARSATNRTSSCSHRVPPLCSAVALRLGVVRWGLRRRARGRGARAPWRRLICEDVDLRAAGSMTRSLVVRAGRPDLAAEPDPAGAGAVTSLDHDAAAGRPARRGRATRSGPSCSRLTTLGRTSAEHRDRGDRRRPAPAPRGRAPSSAVTMPTTAPAASISRIRSRLNSSSHAEGDGQAEPGLPTRDPPEPVHARQPIRQAVQRAGSRRRATGRPAAVLVASASAACRTSSERFSSVSTSLQRAGGDHPALAQQQRVGEARRDLLDVVGDQHRRRRRLRPWRAPTGWRPGPRGRRGRARRRARRAAAARGRSSAPGRSAPACARPR